MSSIFKIILSSVAFLYLITISNVIANEFPLKLFESDFKNNQVNQLNINSGNWMLDADSSLLGYDEEASKSGEFQIGETSWDNYSIITDIHPVLGTDFFIKFRNSERGYYSLNIHLNPFEDQSDKKPQLAISRNTNGVEEILDTEENFLLKNDELYHLEIKADGKKIRISIDEKDVFYIYDLESEITNGNVIIGFETGEYGLSILKIKNIKVTNNSPLKE